MVHFNVRKGFLATRQETVQPFNVLLAAPGKSETYCRGDIIWLVYP